MSALETLLSDSYKVHNLDLPGHGSLADQDRHFSVFTMSEYLGDYLQKNSLTDAKVIGYSMGGYVAMFHALSWPEQIRQIVTIGTKFRWNPEEAETQIKLLDPEKIEEKVPDFASMLADRHGSEHWKMVVRRTAYLMSGLGQEPPLTPRTVQRINIPVHVVVGSEDQMVTREESERVVSCLPNGQIQIIDGIPHEIEKADVKILANVCKSIL